MYTRLSMFLYLQFLFAVGLMHHAASESWDTEFDSYFEAPNADVTLSIQGANEQRSVLTPGGILILQSRFAGQVETQFIDKSPVGAILCNWEILVTVKTAIDNCSELKNPEQSNILSDGIARVNQFIVLHHPANPKLEDIEAGIARRDEAFRKDRQDRPSNACASPDLIVMATSLLDTPSEFEAYVDKLLAIPRIPVMNPCL